MTTRGPRIPKTDSRAILKLVREEAGMRDGSPRSALLDACMEVNAITEADVRTIRSALQEGTAIFDRIGEALRSAAKPPAPPRRRRRASLITRKVMASAFAVALSGLLLGATLSHRTPPAPGKCDRPEAVPLTEPETRGQRR